MTIDYEYAQAEVRELADLFDSAEQSSISDKRAVFWRTAFSPLPSHTLSDTGSLDSHVLVVSALEGIRGSITSQIAVQLSNTALEETAIEVCDAAVSAEHEYPLATEIVRRSLKRANDEVYRYAHKMQAGGRIAARGFLAAYDGGRFTAACVGPFEGFLLRKGKLSSLFDIKQSPNEKAGVLERFIGANSQLLVDLATVRVEENDIVLLTTFAPTDALTEMLRKELAGELAIEKLSQRIVREGARMGANNEDGQGLSVDRNAFVAIIRIKSIAIPLTEVVSS